MYLHGSKQTPQTPPTSSDEDSSGSSEDAEAKKRIGNRAIGKKKYPKAIKYYSKAIKIDPAGAAYRLNRAIANAALELWKNAEEDALRAVELSKPPSAKSHYQLARARLRLGRCYDARKAADAALASFPDEASLRQLSLEIDREAARRDARATAKVAKAKSLEPSGGPSARKPLLDRARSAFNAGRVEEALALLKESLTSAPAQEVEEQWHEMSALSLLGKCSMQLRRWPEAVRAFEELLTLQEKVLNMDDSESREATSNAYNSLGLAYKNTGRLCEAADAMSKAYHMATNGDDQVATAQSAQILQNSGQCLRQEGKLEHARLFFERALEIGQRIFGSEHSSNALNYLCIARCRRDTGELKEAIQAYQKALGIWIHKDPKECLKEMPEMPNEQRLAALQHQCKSELAQLITAIEQARQGLKAGPEVALLPLVDSEN